MARPPSPKIVMRRQKKPHISADKCKSLICTIVDAQIHDRLFAAVKSVSYDPVAVQAFFDRELPNWRMPPKKFVGRYPDSNIAFLLLEELKLEKKIHRLMGRESPDISGQRDTLYHTTQLISAHDFINGTRRSGKYFGEIRPLLR